MNDLQQRLARIASAEAGAGTACTATAGSDLPTVLAQADADLARGRRALRRRRTWRTAGAGVFAAAVLAAGLSYAAPDGPPVQGSPVQELVAYQGQQPHGFTIDKVPAGWEVQGGGAGNLTIAPADAADKNPDNFIGKIAITLQSKDDHSTPSGTGLPVNGRPGLLAKGEGNAESLWVQQPDGVWMQVQIWDARGWTQKDIVEFADGIHVQPGAQQGRG
jgi:hypothetical protein